MEFNCCDEIETQYRLHLSLIKQVLISASSQDVLNLCTEWIWFLNHMRDRIRRNQHAELLLHQLKINKLDIPFTTIPPKDETFLANIDEDKSSDWSDVPESAEKIIPRSPVPSDPKSKSSPLSNTKSNATNSSMIPQMSETNSRSPAQLSSRSTYFAAVQSPRTFSVCKKHNLELLQSIQSYQRRNEDEENHNESGLCKKVSFNPYIDGQYDEIPENFSYEEQVNILQNQVYELLREKNLLVKQLVDCRTQMNLRGESALANVHSLTTEINMLRQKLQELSGIKTSLEAQQGSTIVQWNESLDKLSGRLTSIEEMGNFITMAIEKTDFKIKEMEENTMKEIGVLEETCQEKVKKISEIYTAELQKLKATYEINKQDYKRSGELLSEYEDKLQKKNDEICQLRSMLDNKCKHMTEEMDVIRRQMVTENNKHYRKLNEKHGIQIALYQKYIGKLEKQNGRTKKNYEKKIHALTKDLDLMEKSMEIKLEMQKANLMIHVSNDKQEELYKTVSDLEERYKSLLEEQRNTARLRQVKDQSIIKELKETIFKLERNVNCS